MEDHIGDTFEGIVSSITNFGMFVELPNTIEGLIRMEDLVDDFYYFDDVNFDYVDFYRTNPATGLAMHGGFDSAGNTFGTCWQDYDDRR
jgi:hypothetical protein